MIIKEWEELPDFLKCEEVRPFYDTLAEKKVQLILKRVFDVVTACILLSLLAFPMAVIAVMIKLDSKGAVLYRQERVTAYGKKFKIHKFRTMIDNADRIGTAVTVGKDPRITRVGATLRRLRLDELPQLLDILAGNMSFVGTRPEVTKYVKQYTEKMRATLLLPAGVTSEASIRYKDEAKLLDGAEDIDRVYVEQILPEKMKYNLDSIQHFNFVGEIATMLRTIFAILGKEYQ